MVDRVVLNAGLPFINDRGLQSSTTQRWTQKVSDRATIIGEGAPEGVVSAPQGATYKNVLGATGTIAYFKTVDYVEDPPGNRDDTKGWVLE